MARVAGSSQFLNAATLANRRGISPAATSSVLGSGASTVDLLDAARGIGGNNGIGLSSRARALNKQFLSSTASTFNGIFSLNIGASSSVENLQQQIRALRAGMSDSQLSRALRATDDGGVTASSTGRAVDTEA